MKNTHAQALCAITSRAMSDQPSSVITSNSEYSETPRLPNRCGTSSP